jgi:trigger factor
MAEEGAVRVTTSEEGPVVRRLEIEVDPKRVRRAFDRAYGDLAKRARVKGFRAGKAPRSVLEKMFGPQVREEIERLLVSESLPEAVEEAGVRPVAEPSIDAQAPEEGAPFRYTAEIEVKPTIALPTLEGLPASQPAVEVSDTDVLEQMENLRERHAQLVEEEEGTTAAQGSVLKIDFVGRIDGEPFEGGTGQDVELEIGSDRFIPGFEDQLQGSCIGEDREVSVTFPDDYTNAELAGKEAVFAVHVVSVQRREMPELDDEFAKDLGEFEDLAALRERVRSDLTEQQQGKADAALRQSVLDALVERTEFDVPASLIERRLQSQLSRAHRELEGSVPHEQLHGQLDAWREGWRPRAERDVREALLLEAVAAEREIEVADEELDARLEEMAESQGMDAQRLRSAYQDGELLDAMRVQLKDEKALAFLCAEAKIEETSDS